MNGVGQQQSCVRGSGPGVWAGSGGLSQVRESGPGLGSAPHRSGLSLTRLSPRVGRGPTCRTPGLGLPQGSGPCEDLNPPGVSRAPAGSGPLKLNLCAAFPGGLEPPLGAGISRTLISSLPQIWFHDVDRIPG